MTFKMKYAKQLIVTLIRDESGQDLIEYAIVAGLIGMGAVVSMTNFTGKIRNAFNSIGNQLSNAV